MCREDYIIPLHAQIKRGLASSRDVLALGKRDDIDRVGEGVHVDAGDLQRRQQVPPDAKAQLRVTGTRTNETAQGVKVQENLAAQVFVKGLQLALRYGAR